MSETHERLPDERQLRLLSIFWYIEAGGSALAGCIVMSFALLGVALMLGVVENLPREIGVFLGLILTIIESILALFVFTMAVLEAWTARSLATFSRYRLCHVMACIELINIPFGTTLGIITIIMLGRDTTKALFEGTAYRDPRQLALDDFDEEDEAPREKGKSRDEGAIKEPRKK